MNNIYNLAGKSYIMKSFKGHLCLYSNNDELMGIILPNNETVIVEQKQGSNITLRKYQKQIFLATLTAPIPSDSQLLLNLMLKKDNWTITSTVKNQLNQIYTNVLNSYKEYQDLSQKMLNPKITKLLKDFKDYLDYLNNIINAQFLDPEFNLDNMAQKIKTTYIAKLQDAFYEELQNLAYSENIKVDKSPDIELIRLYIAKKEKNVKEIYDLLNNYLTSKKKAYIKEEIKMQEKINKIQNLKKVIFNDFNLNVVFKNYLIEKIDHLLDAISQLNEESINNEIKNIQALYRNSQTLYSYIDKAQLDDIDNISFATSIKECFIQLSKIVNDEEQLQYIKDIIQTLTIKDLSKFSGYSEAVKERLYQEMCQVINFIDKNIMLTELNTEIENLQMLPAASKRRKLHNLVNQINNGYLNYNSFYMYNLYYINVINYYNNYSYQIYLINIKNEILDNDNIILNKNIINDLLNLKNVFPYIAGLEEEEKKPILEKLGIQNEDLIIDVNYNGDEIKPEDLRKLKEIFSLLQSYESYYETEALENEKLDNLSLKLNSFKQNISVIAKNINNQDIASKLLNELSSLDEKLTNRTINYKKASKKLSKYTKSYTRFLKNHLLEAIINDDDLELVIDNQALSVLKNTGWSKLIPDNEYFKENTQKYEFYKHFIEQLESFTYAPLAANEYEELRNAILIFNCTKSQSSIAKIKTKFQERRNNHFLNKSSYYTLKYLDTVGNSLLKKDETGHFILNGNQPVMLAKEEINGSKVSFLNKVTDEFTNKTSKITAHVATLSDNQYEKKSFGFISKIKAGFENLLQDKKIQNYETKEISFQSIIDGEIVDETEKADKQNIFSSIYTSYNNLIESFYNLSDEERHNMKQRAKQYRKERNRRLTAIILGGVVALTAGISSQMGKSSDTLEPNTSISNEEALPNNELTENSKDYEILDEEAPSLPEKNNNDYEIIDEEQPSLIDEENNDYETVDEDKLSILDFTDDQSSQPTFDIEWEQVDDEENSITKEEDPYKTAQEKFIIKNNQDTTETSKEQSSTPTITETEEDLVDMNVTSNPPIVKEQVKSQPVSNPLAIGDTVSISSNAEIYSNIYDVANDINGMTSYYQDTIYRDIQSIIFTDNMGNIYNATTNEMANYYRTMGYTEVGISALNQYSKNNNDIEGRFEIKDVTKLTLKR